jgi:hypothetical protein
MQVWEHIEQANDREKAHAQLWLDWPVERAQDKKLAAVP